MSLIAREQTGGGGFEPIKAGVFQAVCYAIYDLGTQYNKKWDKRSHECLIIWEIPEERIEIEKNGQKLNLPRVVSRKFTMSLDDRSNLRKILESWRGKVFTADELVGFDISKLINVNGMLQVIHSITNDKTYANIASITPLYKGMAKLVPENPTVIYEIGRNIPQDTPKWIIDIIHQSEEMKIGDSSRQLDDVPEPPLEEPNSDCPF